MSDLLTQFFGDAKRMHLSTTEKAELWHRISTRASAQSLSLSEREHAQCLMHVLDYMRSHPIRTQKSHSFFTLHRFTAVALSVLLLIGAGGGTAAYAAQSAMPDDVLYPVKVHFNEPLIAAMQFTPERRADWEAKLLERRLREAEHVARRNEISPVTKQHLQERIEQRAEFLEQHLDQLPDERRAVIEERVRLSIDEHEALLARAESGAITPEVVREFREKLQPIRGRFGHQRSIPGRLPPRPFVDDLPDESILPPPSDAVDSAAEGWLSGRKRTTRNRVDPQGSRGFESPSLRHDDDDSSEGSATGSHIQTPYSEHPRPPGSPPWGPVSPWEGRADKPIPGLLKTIDFPLQ